MPEPTTEQIIEWRLSPMGEWIAAQEQYIVALQERAQALVARAEEAIETLGYYVDRFYGEDSDIDQIPLARAIIDMKAVL